MTITAAGATDGGNVVLFCPDNLPDDADGILRGPYGGVELIEALRDDGKLIWFDCDGDGDYAVAIFLHEAVPEDLVAFCKNEEGYPRLIVRGEGYFGGMEYVFKRDRSLLDKYPHMMERVRVPEGEYSARVWRTELPEGFRDAWLRRRAGAWAMRIWRLQGNLVLLASASVLATLGALCFLPWGVWFYVLGATAGMIVVAAALPRTAMYRAAEAAIEEFAKAYPSFVVRLS